MESKVLYSAVRDILVTHDDFEDVKNEFIALFQSIRPDLDAILDAKEVYTFNSQGVKILDQSCTPIRTLEYIKPIISNSTYIGYAMLRVTNKRPNFGPTMLMDCMERTYELRFKLYSGALASVEGCNISLVQTDNGGYNISSGSLSLFHKAVLKQEWDEFKSEVAFDLTKPNRQETWSTNRIIYARA